MIQYDERNVHQILNDRNECQRILFGGQRKCFGRLYILNGVHSNCRDQIEKQCGDRENLAQQFREIAKHLQCQQYNATAQGQFVQQWIANGRRCQEYRYETENDACTLQPNQFLRCDMILMDNVVEQIDHDRYVGQKQTDETGASDEGQRFQIVPCEYVATVFLIGDHRCLDNIEALLCLYRWRSFATQLHILQYGNFLFVVHNQERNGLIGGTRYENERKNGIAQCVNAN